MLNSQLSILNLKFMKHIKLQIYLYLLIIGWTNIASPMLAQSANNSDSIKFAKLYVNALKNKMLGRAELAQKQFEDCLKLNPNSTASAYQLAKLLLADKRPQEAEEYAKFCLEHWANNQWYLLLRAKIAKQLNDMDLYKSIYEKLAATYPSNLDYNFELATICYDKQEYNRALSLLNEIENQVNINETVSMFKNSIYYKQKKYALIEIELKKLQNNFPDSTKYNNMLSELYMRFNKTNQAIEMNKAILATDTNNTNAQTSLAWLYAQQENYAQGIPYLYAAIKHKGLKFNRISKLADLYLNARNNDVSDEQINYIFSKLADKPEANAEFMTKYIAYLYSKKDLSNAEKYALIAIKKFPGNYLTWDYYFQILLTMNRYDALRKASLNCLEYFPNQASVYFYCGYSYFSLKNYEKAIKYFKISIDYSIDNKELILQNYLIVAESYHSLGKHEKSDEYFEKYLKISNDNAILLNNYAYYLLERGINFDKALNLSRRSLEIDPFNSSFLDTYAWILFTLKKYKMALNYIERAYKYGGNANCVVLDHYGDILSKLGKTQEANNKWKEAYRINKLERILKKIVKEE